MDSGTEQTFMHLLSRDVLKQNLAKAGLYALAYELLKNSIIDRPKGFFTIGGLETDEYRTEILAKHTNVLIASCRWLHENGAITEDEIAEVLQFREYRNYIAHELQNVLLTPALQVNGEKLLRVFQLLCKIDRWWITEVDIATNPDLNRQSIRPSEVSSGSMEFVSYLIRVVYDLDNVAPVATRPN